VLIGVDAPRQIAAKCGKFSFPKATNCDKFVAAFCRFLPLVFEPRFFLPNLVGDGVSSQNLILGSLHHRHLTVGANVRSTRFTRERAAPVCGRSGRDSVSSFRQIEICSNKSKSPCKFSLAWHIKHSRSIRLQKSLDFRPAT
jgi:hypothetical protein